MNFYEIKLDSIVKKYFPNSFIKKDNIPKFLEQLLNTKCKKRFALWGAGEHTKKLFEYFPQQLKNLVCIIDNNTKFNNEELFGIKIINSNNVKDENIETIILSTFSSRKTIIDQIKNIDSKIETIDLYDYLECEYKIFLDTPFYIKHNVYLDIDSARIKITDCNDCNLKSYAFEEVIYLYLSIRDLYNANNYIDEYIIEFPEIRNKFVDLKNEISNLVCNLKRDLDKRSGKDMVLLFLDSLRAKDVYSETTKMNYLNSILENSIYFTQAFSTSIFTYESVPSMFSGNMPFKDQLYTRKCLTQEETPFICEALKKDYKVKIYTEDIWNMIDGKDVEVEAFKDYASYTLWSGLTDLACSKDEKCFSILYFLREPHTPHVCGKHTKKIVGHVTLFTNTDSVDQTQEAFTNQYNECLEYLDSQLKFYGNLIPNSLTQIIFADHGQVIEEAKKNVNEIGTLASWHDDKTHVPIIIKKFNYKPFKNDKLFSTINFNELVIGLLNDKLNIVESNIVEMNFSRTQNNIIRENYIKAGCEDYIDGYKAFRDYTHKVAVTGNGKIKVYELSNEDLEIIDEEYRKNIIDKFAKYIDLNMPQLI